MLMVQLFRSIIFCLSRGLDCLLSAFFVKNNYGKYCSYGFTFCKFKVKIQPVMQLSETSIIRPIRRSGRSFSRVRNMY